MTFTTEPLPEARVKLTITVPAAEFDSRLGEAAEKLSTAVKMPGFREGKVPAELVVQKVGREAVFQQAFEDSVTEWYSDVMGGSDLAPIGSPQLAEEVHAPESGAPFEFALEVAVRPDINLRPEDYENVEAGRAEPEYDPEAVDRELATMQERFATLAAVDRPAGKGDFVQVDFTGRLDGEVFDGGSAKDFVLELGSERFIEGFEGQLIGVKAGDEKTVSVLFPSDYGNQDLAGKPAEFEVKVHEVQEKQLTEITDEFAQENLGYDSIQELRDEIEQRLRQQAGAAVDREYRVAVVDVVAQRAEINVPVGHIHSRAHELWHEMAMSMVQRGIDPAAYVQAMGKTEHEFITDAEPDAEKTIRRECVIAAVIEQQGIEVTEEDMIEAMIGGDEEQRQAAEEQLAKIRDAGRERQFIMDVAGARAVDFLVSKATPIAQDLAEARDAMWTPEKGAQEASKEAGAAAGGLWTPGS